MSIIVKVTETTTDVTAAATEVPVTISGVGIKGNKGDKGDPGEYAPGGTDVAVADGGTGASTAEDARTNLGVPGLSNDNTWTGDQQFNGQVVIKGDGEFDVRAGTGYDPLAADNSSAFADAVSRASANGGTVVLPVGDTGFSGAQVIPAQVGIRGWGAGRGQAVSRLVAQNASASIQDGARGANAGAGNKGPAWEHFEIDGAGVATNPWYIGLVVDREYRLIEVYSAATTNLLIEEAQNLVFTHCSSKSAPNNLIFDYGTGGHVFNRWYSRAASSTHIKMIHTGVDTPGLLNGPSNLTFNAPYLEGWESGVTDYILQNAGQRNKFVVPILTSPAATAAVNLVNVEGDPGGSIPNTELILVNPSFTGDGSNTTAIRAGTGRRVHVDGQMFFTGIPESQRLVEVGAGSIRLPFANDIVGTSYVDSSITFSSVSLANRRIYHRIMTQFVPHTISKIGLQIQDSSGNIQVDYYGNLGQGRSATPTGLLASSGSVACPATGYAEVALGSSVTARPGDWLSLSCDNTTATFYCAGTNNLSSNLWQGRAGFENSAFAPPATPTVSWGLTKGFFLIGVP